MRPSILTPYRIAHLRELLCFVGGSAVTVVFIMLLPAYGAGAAPGLAVAPDLALPRLTMAGTGFTASSMLGAERELAAAAAPFFHVRDGCRWLYDGVEASQGTLAVTAELAMTRQRTRKPGVASAVFANDVTVTTADARIAGDLLWIDSDKDFRIEGSPATLNREGTSIAGLSMEMRDELVVVGDAWARLETPQLPLATVGNGDGDGAVYAEAPRATFSDDSNAFRFEGGARAWSGSHLLTAEVIAGEGATLSATGDVRLDLRMPDGQGLTVDAAELTWSEGIAVFAGAVEAITGGRSLSCDRLEVEIDDERVTALDCSGALVAFTDELSGDRIRDARRIRYVEGKQLQVEGVPARVEMADGSVVRGAMFTREFSTGVVVVTGPLA